MGRWGEALPRVLLPRELANDFGPPRLLAADGTLRDSDPELLADAEPVWGRIATEM
jgi:hypothetical protein